MASTISFGNSNAGFQVGQAFAPIKADFHVHPDRPETPPQPSSTVPFRRDSDFIERQAIFEQICLKCAVPESWTALVGLGGAGKSQLAIEYSYHVRERTPEPWVFWVYAVNAARFEQSYRDIADRGKIPGRHDPKINILKLVYDWLCDRKREKWLLVLDNVDDSKTLLDTQVSGHDEMGSLESQNLRPLRDYVPISPNGSILMTTRSKEVALKLVEENDIISVGPMDEKHAVALFQKKVIKRDENAVEDIHELVALLDFLPLAVVQAASYIHQRAPRYNVQRYLEEFRKNEKRRTRLLEFEGGHLRRDRDATNSILVTWQISFSHIREIQPPAADLLSLMSFFDRQEIPEALLHTDSKSIDAKLEKMKIDGSDKEEEKEESLSEGSYDSEFEDNVSLLRDYSFISVKADGQSFEMHALVQLSTRKWLAKNKQLERWRACFIDKLWMEYPTGEYENWARCQELFPHAKSAMEQQPQGNVILDHWIKLLDRASEYAMVRGMMTDAAEMSKTALQAAKTEFGGDSVATLNCMETFAKINGCMGRWDDAEELEKQVLETRKRVLGAEHLNTLDIMNALSLAYMEKGKSNEAEELLKQEFSARRRLQGAEHPSTLASIENLATAYSNQARLKEAAELQEQVLSVQKRRSGIEHPNTAECMSNLAITYFNQGRYNEAEELQKQVLMIMQKIFGVENSDTLRSMNNLARTYMNQGHWKEAEKLQEQAIELMKRTVGFEHPITLKSMTNLGWTYTSRGRWKEAEELQEQTTKTMKRVLGAEHPATLLSVNNLAQTYSSQGKWKEAEDVQEEVLRTQRTKLGVEHPDTLRMMCNLAFIYFNQERLTEAQELGERVLEVQKRALGLDHSDTLSAMSNLSATYSAQGRLKQAEELQEQVIKTQKRVLGTEHPLTLRSMNNLAVLYWKQTRLKEATQLEEQAVEMHERILGTEHPETLRCMDSLFNMYWDCERWEEAEEMAKQHFVTKKRMLGAGNLETLTSMKRLALTRNRMGKNQEALTTMEECLELQTQLFGPSHPDTLTASWLVIAFKAGLERASVAQDAHIS